MRKRTAITWLAVTAWWLLTGLVWTGQMMIAYQVGTVEGDAPTTLQELSFHMIHALLWIPHTMVLFWCVRHSPIERGRIWRSVGLLMLAVLGLIVIRTVAAHAFYPIYPVSPDIPALEWYDHAQLRFLQFLLPSWMVIGVAHALLFAERESRRREQNAELEARLAQARFDALSAQIDPHFLFNALNSIAELVHRDPEAADRMLVGLGGLLRHGIEGGSGQQVTLGEELELVSQYVEIEQARLGPRLRFESEVADDVYEAMIPRLLLQPLVENAVRHGIAPRNNPGRVTLSARRRLERLFLEVSDDGTGASPESRGHGIGLANIRARLQSLYQDDHRFELEPAPGGGTRARIELPLQMKAMA
jgi:LytS/YehU family sensor histidine kinase